MRSTARVIRCAISSTIFGVKARLNEIIAQYFHVLMQFPGWLDYSISLFTPEVGPQLPISFIIYKWKQYACENILLLFLWLLGAQTVRCLPVYVMLKIQIHTKYISSVYYAIGGIFKTEKPTEWNDNEHPNHNRFCRMILTRILCFIFVAKYFRCFACWMVVCACFCAACDGRRNCFHTSL